MIAGKLCLVSCLRWWDVGGSRLIHLLCYTWGEDGSSGLLATCPEFLKGGKDHKERVWIWKD